MNGRHGLVTRAELVELLDRPDPWADHVGARVVMNLRTGEALHGTLAASTPGSITLVDAELFEEGRSPTKVDGRTIIDLAAVSFGQVVT